MQGQHSLRSYPGNRKPVAFLQPSPRQNHILAALPLEDYERLLPYLELFPLLRNGTVYGTGEREKYLYFLSTGLVSQFYVMENGASAEFSITGSEGVIGVASFLGGEGTPSQSVVQAAGHAYRLHENILKNECTLGGPLLAALLRYTQVLLAQIAQLAVCNRHHSLEQRLSRWILSCLDRLPSNELTITQESIANMLGVRREGVTEAAQRLQSTGVIHCSRGHITVRDRPQLEAQACECYAVVKREHERLLSADNITGNAGAHGTCHQYHMNPVGQRTGRQRNGVDIRYAA